MEISFKNNENFREDLKLGYLKLIYEYGYDKVLSQEKEETKEVETKSQTEEVEIGGMKK
jgi:hypothetical protein